MLEVGEKIYSDVTGKTYTVTWASDKITQAEVGFASTPADGEAYFIKRLLSMKYPTDSSLGSSKMKEERKRKCDEHFRKYSSLYRSIKAGCGSDGACVPIEDFFRDGAFYYTVYQKINASSLSLSEISSLSTHDKYKLLLRLVQGLQPIHTQGVIHGDLKPDNILVQRDGIGWKIRLIDMNDCYHAGEPNAPGEVIGTPDYYSPELTEYNTYEVEDYEDEKEMAHVKKLADSLTTKSDIFALGIIFCEFFSGERPFVSSEEIKHIAEAAKEGVLRFPASIPSGFADLLSSMLAVNYKVRPSLNVIADKLKALMDRLKRMVQPKITLLAKDSKSADVEITCEGASAIYYTLDNSAPTEKSKLYDGVLHLARTTTVKCIGKNADGELGSISCQTFYLGRFSMKVSSKEPTIRVNGRRITIMQNSASKEGTILYYTIDGTRPTVMSSRYERPFIVPDSVTQIKAVAKEPEENKMISLVVSATVYKGRLKPPEIHFKKGLVSMESSEDASIYYTKNGDVPDEHSVLYESPFYVEDMSNFVIKAICVKKNSLESEISEIRRPSKIKMS